MNSFHNRAAFLLPKKTGMGVFVSAIILFTMLISFTSGCGGGGGNGSVSAPSGLTYTSTSSVYTTSLKIADNVPEYSGTATEWTIDPELPEGLSLNRTSGVISGTPVADQMSVQYKVTAFNSAGSTAAVISIAVKDTAPSALDYAAISAVYTKGLEITENRPSYIGTVSQWSISPELPMGLVFHNDTGVISGTPENEQQAAYYTVTASNSEGSVTADISITVKDVPPSSLEYSLSASVYIKNQAIIANTPVYSGTVTSWSVAPDLPAGLTLDEATGSITGTPLYEQPAADYTVTAANSYGSASFVISITVNDAPPSVLTYSNDSAVYTINESIAENNPSVSGTVTSWSVTPGLPAGLTLNTTTGVITGIPEEVQQLKEYVITASNEYGSASAAISIIVNEQAPAGLSYIKTAAVYTKGLKIADNLPHLETGSSTSWSVTPALPAGLILNTATGAISGTPENNQALKNYTVTASNSQGEVSAVISIKVNDVAPTGLVYTPSTVTLGGWFHITRYFYLSTSITLTPSYTGTVISWSISPALPSGVTLNTSTGLISGKGVIDATRYYTITAGNSGGSVSAQILIISPAKP